MRSVTDYSSPYMIQSPPISATSTRIRTITAAELESVLPDLVQIFRDVVNGGVPLGFLAPITLQTAHEYWLSVVPELEAGTRILLVAQNDGGVLGSGQLALAQRPNSQHRAELQKLRRARGPGDGDWAAADAGAGGRCSRARAHADPAQYPGWSRCRRLL